MDNKQQEIQVEISPEMAQGTYANLVFVAHSQSDFVLDFARIVPGMPKAPVKSRVILTPENAKRLLAVLKDSIDKYESMFGPIQENRNPQVPPFFGPKGNA